MPQSQSTNQPCTSFSLRVCIFKRVCIFDTFPVLTLTACWRPLRFVGLVRVTSRCRNSSTPPAPLPPPWRLDLLLAAVGLLVGDSFTSSSISSTALSTASCALSNEARRECKLVRWADFAAGRCKRDDASGGIRVALPRRWDPLQMHNENKILSIFRDERLPKKSRSRNSKAVQFWIALCTS